MGLLNMASILLVEDNDDHAILAQAALSGSDRMFDVERAISAEECLNMLVGRDYDAIVMDYSLPRRNGLEILQDIEKLSYDVPVVMITSHGDERIAVESIKRGAYDYVTKSDDYLAKLPLVLQKAIEAHEMARERAELQNKIEESENRLRNIFDNVEVGIVEVNDDCSISYANPKAKHYLNIDDNLQDTNICALFMGNGKGCASCEVGKCLKNGGSVSYEIEHNNRQFSATFLPLYLAELSLCSWTPQTKRRLKEISGLYSKPLWMEPRRSGEYRNIQELQNRKNLQESM